LALILPNFEVTLGGNPP